MALELLMPALSPTMEEGNIANWLKKEGDTVKSGDIIAEIETDKAIMEFEVSDSGTIGKILVPSGTNGVKVNTLIAILLEKGDDASAIDAIIAKHSGGESKKADVSNTAPQSSQAVGQNSQVEQKPKSDERVFASPLAKRIAQQISVDISTVEGSGPNGRVIKKDVESASVKPQKQTVQQTCGRNPTESTLVPHSNMRRVIAKRLVESKQTVPHFYVAVDVSVKALNKTRVEMNKYLEQFEEKISVNDILIKACANALKTHPNVNSSWSNDGTILYNNVDISVAVGVKDGLITPIVKNADTKTLRVISAEMKSLIKKAKDGKLTPEEFQGGGFSVSNLGMYGVSSFNAIVNPPQSAIIAISGVKSVVKICKKTGNVYEDETITLTLSCDHRVIDGVLAAEFLNTVKCFVENPSFLVL